MSREMQRGTISLSSTERSTIGIPVPKSTTVNQGACILSTHQAQHAICSSLYLPTFSTSLKTSRFYSSPISLPLPLSLSSFLLAAFSILMYEWIDINKPIGQSNYFFLILTPTTASAMCAPATAINNAVAFENWLPRATRKKLVTSTLPENE